MCNRASLRGLAIVVFALIACTIQAWPFLSGIRLTADEIRWHTRVMQGFDGVREIFDWLLYEAKDQGRIGHFVNHAGHLLSVATHEHLAARIAFVAAWFATMYLFARYVTEVAAQGRPVVLFLVLTALLPLEFHHLPPTSYPLILTPAILGLLAMRLYLHARYLAPSRPAPLLPLVLLSPAAWLMVIYIEFATAFAASLIVMTYWGLSVAEGAGKHGLRSILLRHRRVVAFDVLSLAVPLAFYLVFRILKGDAYDGVEVGGNVADAIETLVMHVVSGTGLHRLAAFAPQLPALWSLIGAFGAAACLLAMALSGTRAASGRAGLAVAAGCSAMAALVTLPVAATERYQHWCVDQGTCLYIDSRLSYLWIVAAGWLAVHAAGRVISEPLRSGLGLALCAAVASGFYATHSRNVAVAAQMAEIAQAWPRARALACSQTSAWENLDDAALLEIVDPSSRVSMHADADRGAYWRLYMRHSIANGACAA